MAKASLLLWTLFRSGLFAGGVLDQGLLVAARLGGHVLQEETA